MTRRRWNNILLHWVPYVLIFVSSMIGLAITRHNNSVQSDRVCAAVADDRDVIHDIINYAIPPNTTNTNAVEFRDRVNQRLAKINRDLPCDTVEQREAKER